MNEKQQPALSAMSRWETAAALCWIPIHVVGLPLLLAYLRPGISAASSAQTATVLPAPLCIAESMIRFMRRTPRSDKSDSVPSSCAARPRSGFG